MTAEWIPTASLSRANVSYWNHWPLQSAGRNGDAGSVAEGEVAENEARASVGGNISVVSSELIAELTRKGVLAGDMGNGMVQRLAPAK